MAYNLPNFMRTLALPKEVEHWSLTTLRENLLKIGAKVVHHGRYITFQLAEVAVPRNLIREILRRIDGLRPKATSTILNGSLESCRLTGEVRLGEEKLDQTGFRTRSNHQYLAVRRLRR